jgi:hypothetical protein
MFSILLVIIAPFRFFIGSLANFTHCGVFKFRIGFRFVTVEYHGVRAKDNHPIFWNILYLLYSIGEIKYLFFIFNSLFGFVTHKIPGESYFWDWQQDFLLFFLKRTFEIEQQEWQEE